MSMVASFGDDDETTSMMANCVDEEELRRLRRVTTTSTMAIWQAVARTDAAAAATYIEAVSAALTQGVAGDGSPSSLVPERITQGGRAARRIAALQYVGP